MKIKSATIGKELLTNLGNYSNLKVSHYITVEVEEGEVPNFDAIYDEINRHLQLEHDNTEQMWLKSDDLKDSYKLTIKLPKHHE